MLGEHVLWRDVADGTVQTHVVVIDVTHHQTKRIFERQRRPGPNALQGYVRKMQPSMSNDLVQFYNCSLN